MDIKSQCVNPFENYPELFEDVFMKKHECPTVTLWNEEEKTNHEYYTDELCINGCCEYCYGHRYNEWFAEKPTLEEVREYILRQKLKCDLAEKQKKNNEKKAMLKIKDEDQLITICINQDYKQIPDLFRDIIAVIRDAKYSFLMDANAVCEVTGKNGKFNPHIHIHTRKIKRDGQVAQVLRRKLVNEKYQVYNIDVKSLPRKEAMDYVEGYKTGDKLEATAKDKEYREANNLDHIYEIC